ncbi:MAG: hypothetical protein ACXW1Q_07570 [Halobacteriota archaeon]
MFCTDLLISDGLNKKIRRHVYSYAANGAQRQHAANLPTETDFGFLKPIRITLR